MHFVDGNVGEGSINHLPPQADFLVPGAKVYHIPGTVVGAMLSSRLPSGIIRAALTVVLLASGLKLLCAPNLAIGAVVVVALVAAPILWLGRRRPRRSPRAEG